MKKQYVFCVVMFYVLRKMTYGLIIIILIICFWYETLPSDIKCFYSSAKPSPLCHLWHDISNMPSLPTKFWPSSTRIALNLEFTHWRKENRAIAHWIRNGPHAEYEIYFSFCFLSTESVFFSNSTAYFSSESD